HRGQQMHECVYHDITYQVDLFGCYTFAQQVGIAIGGGRKEQVGQLVGKQPVDLFWHRAVKGTQSGFHVADSHFQLGAYQSGCNARVDITVDEYQIRLVLEHHRLKARHNLSSLLGMATGTNV